MSSAFDTRFAAAAGPMLKDEHGQDVTQWPKGHEGAKVSGTGLWSPDLTPARQGDTDGDQTTLGGTLQVEDAEHISGGFSLSSEDVWVINDEVFSTLAMSDPQAGWRTLTLQRVSKFSTSRHRTKL